MHSRSDLHGYQRRAIAMMLSQSKMYLAIGMGLGKTVSALTGVSDLLAAGEKVKALVIAPKRVAETVWAQEAADWTHLAGLRVKLVAGSVSQRALVLSQDADVWVIGRDNIAWLVEHLKKWHFNLMIIDEASSFKDSSTKRFKMLKRVSAQVDRCWLLSGTPGNLLQLWPQYYLLDNGERLGRTLSAYKNAYFTADYMGWSFAPKEGAEQAILAKIKDITVSMQAEDYLELPERIDTMVKVTFDAATDRAYKDLERDYLLQHGADTLVAANAAVLAGKLLQLANGCVYNEHKEPVEIHTGKLDALDDIVEAADGPLLVFYLFRHDLARIKARHPKAVELKGDAEVRDWNASKTKLLLAHPASCGHGLNLQKAKGAGMVWFGLPWSLELYEQANARIHRQGVEDTVVVQHILVAGSIDQDVYDVLQTKAATQDRLLQALKARYA
jgi:SNF2 family DNA or RNA helicase